MVTITSADKALKEYYLSAICDQLNNKISPFYAQIEKGSEEISGKSIVAPTKIGVNGGIGSGEEDGYFPVASNSLLSELSMPLRNIYGTIEITDKALRASRNDAGAIINLLNLEVDGLLHSAKFNFGRMLWQTGTGELTKLGDMSSHTNSNWLPIEDYRNLSEGMLIDIVDPDSEEVISTGHRILRIDRDAKKMYINPTVPSSITLQTGYILTLQNSYNREIAGVPYMFDHNQDLFYGLSRNSALSILPYEKSLGGALTTEGIQECLDELETRSGSVPNIIMCSPLTRRKYVSCMETTRSNVDYMNIAGGFKALSYNGIPLYAERFAPDGNMYFLNTKDFKLVQLCDWEWIEGNNGHVLNQIDRTATYSGTLVKYANLLCMRTSGQALLKDIK